MGQGWKTMAGLFCCTLRALHRWGESFAQRIEMLTLLYLASVPDVLCPDLG